MTSEAGSSCNWAANSTGSRLKRLIRAAIELCESKERKKRGWDWARVRFSCQSMAFPSLIPVYRQTFAGESNPTDSIGIWTATNEHQISAELL